MKIISWNVAGLRACLKKGFEDFFNEVDADVFCLQETKLLEEQLEFIPEEYEHYLYPAVRKGYSGTMIYTKIEPLNVVYGINDQEYDDEGRTITMEFDDFYLVTCYVTNIKRDLSRMESRMRFEDVMRNYLLDLTKKKNVVYCGDLNVAHEEIDIKNAKANRGNAGFTDEERAKMTELLNAGFIDTFRYFNKDEVKYTWWSYMGKARENNIGWRIDYFITNKDNINNIKNTMIYDKILGSDHCPIGIEIK